MKLSIITITYNDGPGLERTLNSLKPLLDASGLQWENIVVDSSPEINSPILAHFANWPLVRIETPPRGIYPAFNLGIEHASGEFIWFLNGGDRLLNVKNLLGALESFHSSVDLVCAPVEIYRSGEFTYNSRVKPEFISNLLGGNNLCHQGMLYRRSVFDRVGLFDVSYKLAGDYEHHFKCYFKGLRFGTFVSPIAQYDRDGRSDNFKGVFREYRRVWKNFRSQLDPLLNIQNISLGAAYFLRLKIMKFKYLGPFSKPLKRIWYYLQGN